MRTPSLRKRVVVLGVVVVVAVLAGVNTFVALTFRAEMLRTLDAVLRERIELVRSAATTRSGPGLAAAFTEIGLRATVRSPDGSVYVSDPASPRSEGSTVSRDVTLSDGSIVTVFASRSRVDDVGRRLLFLQAAALVMATILAAVLLHRTLKFALGPLEQIAAAARRTALLDTLEATAVRASDAQTETELLYLNLRQVIETANAAFLGMDSSGVITEWNRKAEEIFGWTEREVVGRVLAETLIPPELRPAHTAGLHRFLDTGEHRVLGKTVEMEALHRDGHLIPVEVATWVTHVGDKVTFSALLHDISERRKGEDAIGRLASIVESAQEAIFSTSLDGTILTWNLGAERLYSYTAEGAIGRPVSIIVPPERASEVAEVLERVQKGGGVGRHETVRRRQDGSLVDVAVTSSPIFDGWGVVTGASTIARDITEQRRIAIALDDTMRALERALDEARRSEERNRQFLADAAHQLRSPIAGVRACAETLLVATEERDHDALLADLVRETARAGRLISSLLRLARMDQMAPATPQPCDVVALCQSEVDRTRVMAPGLRVALQVDTLPDERPELDPHGLTEILSNLLDNARRHAVTLVQVSIRVEHAVLQILVSDDGSGIDKESAGRIFHRFVSLDGKGGSGLGLPIARGLARAAGGDLTYDSMGFMLTIPFHSKLGKDVRLDTQSR